MSNVSLEAFVEKITKNDRINFGDVRRLQRDVLPDGIASREEADILIALDRDIGRIDPAWTDWLVGALVDYVVWGERPTGYITADKATWITAALDGGGRATKTARLIAREIAREAHSTDEALVAFAMGAPAMDAAAPASSAAVLAA